MVQVETGDTGFAAMEMRALAGYSRALSGFSGEYSVSIEVYRTLRRRVVPGPLHGQPRRPCRIPGIARTRVLYRAIDPAQAE